ncbi:MAG: hypothetical protein CUN56_09625 [Phototrophicales bacterium]|nr:MAG: hypothetical protein CUN56_09625 [Phototrophicales bacterium]
MAAVFGGLQADNYDRQYSDRYLLRRIITYFARYKTQLIWITFTFLIVSIASALPPILIADGVTVLQENGHDNVIALLIGALFVTAIIQYGANWVRRYLLSVVIGSVVANLRKDAFAAAVERDLAFYDTHKSGKIVSRITSDTQEFGDVVLLTSDVFAQLVQVVLLLLVLMSRSVSLTLVLLLTLPMIVGAATAFRWMARIVTRQGSRAMAAVNDTIQETVTGISVAKNFRKESMIYDEFVKINTQSYNINMKRGFVLALIFPVLNALAGFAIAIPSAIVSTLPAAMIAAPAFSSTTSRFAPSSSPLRTPRRILALVGASSPFSSEMLAPLNPSSEGSSSYDSTVPSSFR